MQRNEALDNVKGIAILLVMIGHCIVLNGLNQTDPYIYDGIKSVQMPLFMFVSGILAAGGSGLTFKKLVSRARSYLIPFFVWFLIAYLWAYIPAKSLSLGSFGQELKMLLFEPDRGLWFLLTLFVITVLMTIADELSLFGLKKASGYEFTRSIVTLGIATVFYFLIFLQARSGFSLFGPYLVVWYMPFYMMGYAVGKWKILGFLDSCMPVGKKAEFGEEANLGQQAKAGNTRTATIWIILAALLAGFICFIVVFDLTAPADSLGVIVLQLMASTLGTLGIFGLVYKLSNLGQKKDKPSMLAFIGQYTLEIYVLHFRFARILGLKDKNLSFYSPKAFGYLLLTFLIMSVLTAISIWVISRVSSLRFLLFGKKLRK